MLLISVLTFWTCNVPKLVWKIKCDLHMSFNVHPPEKSRERIKTFEIVLHMFVVNKKEGGKAVIENLSQPSHVYLCTLAFTTFPYQDLLPTGEDFRFKGCSLIPWGHFSVPEASGCCPWADEICLTPFLLHFTFSLPQGVTAMLTERLAEFISVMNSLRVPQAQ